MGVRKGAYRIWWRYLKKGDHLEDLGVDGTSRSGMGWSWTGLIGLRIRTGGWSL
jgi:hypothetical protein